MTYGISFKDAYNVGGGDGMHAAFVDDHTLLVSSQNGNTGRVDLDTMERQAIAPVQPEKKPEPGKPGYRWYWTAPLIVSTPRREHHLHRGRRGVPVHRSRRDVETDQSRSDRAYRSRQVGDDGRAGSLHGALSRHDGQTNFSALTVVAESPLDKNLLYTGADDGTIQMTRDGGQHWTNLTQNVPGLPPMLNISGIVASKYAAGRVYLTVDGHFNDDYHAYVFVSEDYGQTWRAITSGLPETSVHRIREHPSKAELAGGRHGDGRLRDVRSRRALDLAQHQSYRPCRFTICCSSEKSHALVLGTHGRGIWVLDHDEPLTQITPEIAAKEFLFPDSAGASSTSCSPGSSGSATANFSRRIPRRARW